MSDIPPISTTLMPPDLRSAGPRARAVYAAALSFEQQLTEQLTASISTGTTGDDPDDPDADGSDSSTSILQSMLPQALAQGVSDAGGLGLAAELTRSMLQGSR